MFRGPVETCSCGWKCIFDEGADEGPSAAAARGELSPSKLRSQNLLPMSSSYSQFLGHIGVRRCPSSRDFGSPRLGVCLRPLGLLRNCRVLWVTCHGSNTNALVYLRRHVASNIQSGPRHLPARAARKQFARSEGAGSCVDGGNVSARVAPSRRWARPLPLCLRPCHHSSSTLDTITNLSGLSNRP
jgi:hypothetical protein